MSPNCFNGLFEENPENVTRDNPKDFAFLAALTIFFDDPLQLIKTTISPFL